MALSILFFFSLLFILSNAKNPPKPLSFILPINKDTKTNQYYTKIQIGSNSTSVNVLIDLSGNFLWFQSIDYFKAASSYRPIKCNSQICHAIETANCIINTPCVSSRPVPECRMKTCADIGFNPFTGSIDLSAIGQDILHVHSTRGDHYNVRRYPFQYSTDPNILQHMSTLTTGIIGLGRTELSLVSQLWSSFKIRQFFALCLPSNHGNIIIGQGGDYKDPFRKISKELITTPLIKNPVSTYGYNVGIEYFISVSSIRVDKKTLSLNKTLLSIDTSSGSGGTSIRTVRSYTSLHKSIYDVLISEFVKAAVSKKIKRVGSIAPFGACFDSKTIAKSKTGPQVPIIDLVLQKENVFWRFYGSNSMVKVSENVVCLAFVEEILDFEDRISPSIIVGGHQMENYLIEFDVDSSQVRLSSSLVLHHTSCSHFGAS